MGMFHDLKTLILYKGPRRPPELTIIPKPNQMSYKPYHIYHIYNQGNNRGQIFFEERNYIYFLRKMKKHLIPHVELLAYCLMPNHFHWLVCVKEEGCSLSKMLKPTRVESRNGENHFQQQLSASIAIMLRSYTRGINKQQGRSGSLFRQKTKIEDGDVGIPIFNLTKLNSAKLKQSDVKSLDKINLEFNRARYWTTCLNYIHMNPVKAEFVHKPADWSYSSAREYLQPEEYSICNVNLATEIGLTDDLVI